MTKNLPIKGKSLLVVESEWGGDEKLIKQLVDKYIANGTSLHVLWMCDSDYDGSLHSISDTNFEITVILAGQYLQREMASFTEELTEWASGILDNFSDLPDLWRSRIFEFHFNHWLWMYLVRFNIFVAQVEEGGYDVCYITGHKDFVAICQNYCQQKQLPFYSSVSRSGSSLVQIINSQFALWIRNLASEVCGWWLTHKISYDVNADTWIYASYPRNWRRSENKLSNRFIGLLTASTDYKKSSAYLISLTRFSERRLKNLRQIGSDLKALTDKDLYMQYGLVESFGSIWEILKCYFGFGAGFRWLKRWYSLAEEGKVSWHGVNLSRYLFAQILGTVLVDWPKNRYLEKCVVNALKKRNAKSLLVPIFELVEGRSIVKAGKQSGVKVVGIQHGVIGLAHRWRVVLPQGLMKKHGGEDFQPDVIAVEGQVTRSWLDDAGIEDDRIAVVGAPRIIDNLPLANIGDFTRTILVLGEFHRPQVFFDWCAQNLVGSGYKVVIRPHPSHYKKAQVWLKEQPKESQDQLKLSPVGGSLAEDLLMLKPVCLLASVTGAMVDVALRGWPVGVVFSNWLPDYAPLTAVEDKGAIFSSQDRSEVLGWITRLVEDARYRKEYSRACREVARQHIAMTKEDAASALAEIL